MHSLRNPLVAEEKPKKASNSCDAQIQLAMLEFVSIRRRGRGILRMGEGCVDVRQLDSWTVGQLGS